MRKYKNDFTSFSDLLGRFELWSVATEIIKLSGIPAIMMLNQQSTSIRTNCSSCTKYMERCGWLCDKCRHVASLCAIW